MGRREAGDKAAAGLSLQWDDAQPPVTQDLVMGTEKVGELKPEKGMFE